MVTGFGGGGLQSQTPAGWNISGGSSGGGGGSSGGGGGGGGGGQSYVSPEELAKRAAQLQAEQKAQEQATEEKKKKEALEQLKEDFKKKVETAKLAKAYQSKQPPTNIVFRGSSTSNVKTKVGEVPLYYTSTSPVIVKEQTGTFKSRGETVPTYKYSVFEPAIYTGTGVSNTRAATSEELKFVSAQESVLKETKNINTLGYKFTNTFSNAKTDYEEINYALSEQVMKGEKGFNILFKKLTGEDFRLEPAPYLKDTWIGKAQELQSGIITGAYKQVRDRPLDTALIYGSSVGAGFLVKGAVTGLAAIPKVGKVLGIAAQTTLSTSELYLGGSYALGVGGKVLSAGSPKEAGEIVGSEAYKGFIFGKGYSRGKVGFEQVRGIYATRGLKYLEVKQGEYPQAPSQSHLKLFKENVIKELGDKPGSFHTTSEVFWKQGTITPTSGGSEIAGLYASTQISTPFAKISGTTGSGLPKLNNKGFKLFFESLFIPTSSPGVAYLTPKGFRQGNVKYSPTKLFEGQKLIKGKGYAYFSQAAKQGYADVPSIKTEIEAIFRPDAGAYSFKSTGYYTIIKGRRVAIDTFDYGGANTITGNVVSFNGVKGYGGRSSYTLPTSEKSILFSISKDTGVSSAKSYSLPSSSLSTALITSKVSGGYSSKGYSKSNSLSSKSLSSSLSSISKTSKISKVSKSSTIYRASKGNSYNNIFSTGKITEPKPNFKLKRFNPKIKSSGSYNIFLRRFGKFKQVGTASDINKAFSIGTSKAQRTLGATFYIKGVNAAFKTPKGFYAKKEKVGTVFIQMNKYRLGTYGEKSEIQRAARGKKLNFGRLTI